MKSTGPLNTMLHEIEARGWIIVHKYKSRAIEILDASARTAAAPMIEPAPPNHVPARRTLGLLPPDD